MTRDDLLKNYAKQIDGLRVENRRMKSALLALDMEARRSRNYYKATGMRTNITPALSLRGAQVVMQHVQDAIDDIEKEREAMQ